MLTKKLEYSSLDEHMQYTKMYCRRNEFVGVCVLWREILSCICTFRLKIWRFISMIEEGSPSTKKRKHECLLNSSLIS